MNLPNILTVSRIVFVIPILLCLSSARLGWNILAAFFFFLASFTDLADGFIARSRGEVTALGKLLDPLADKILLLSALIPLVALERVPPWLAVLVLAREFAVTGLRGMAALKGISMGAGGMGKAKTFLYTLALLCLMVHLQVLGMLILLLGVVVALYSAYEYFAEHKDIFAREG
ncbi:MAG: CDP-diacylglycerol--glycerol-3-phosphate 3-phosphatidyltransferase [Aquificota bacterium]|nr:MAG: CDP-diacylglycerol--glycerol-3-phosphate 3-phosphatidyltransferase [Aquificota bacterium]RLD98191.1 MAG: CDP-diacylglycerol--glycerol-3-phosphate 3-phosphatidyltransferase [Aquificota bacterium]RLD99464.1 MAG: CDP-diacylglycerol--glycerol-3-phosphate 3-phosphatidyltransferase [Aquificota bacterium]